MRVPFLQNIQLFNKTKLKEMKTRVLKYSSYTFNELEMVVDFFWII